MVIRYLIYIFILLHTSGVGAISNEYSRHDVTYYQSGKQMTMPDFHLWQRELITINVDIYSSEEFSYLKFNKPTLKDYLFDFKIIPSPTVDNIKDYKKQLRIYIWPLFAGKKVLDLPNISLMLSGRSIKSIKLPTLTLNVTALADYLPPGFPVGKISHNSSYQSNSLIPFILEPGNLSSYVLETTSIGIHPSLIPNYSTYLKAPNITRLVSSKETNIKNYDVVYTYHQTQFIPIVIKTSGIHSFNDFKVQYFEPIAGKISSPMYSAALIVTLNIFFLSVLVILVCIILYKTIRRLLIIKRNILLRRSIWKSIYSSTTPRDLSLIIRQLDVRTNLLNYSVNCNTNVSVKQWAMKWKDKYLTKEINLLVQLIYTETPSVDFITVKNKVINQLERLDSIIFHAFMAQPRS